MLRNVSPVLRLCVLLLVGLAMANALQVGPPKLQVNLTHRTCAHANDCSFTAVSCCSQATCDYVPINANYSRTYQLAYQDYVSENCLATMCIAMVCNPLPLACSKENICVFADSSTEPPCDEYACLESPCAGKTCELFPHAKCVENYCGGCNYDFYENGTIVNCSSGSSVCPDGTTPWSCLTNPCDVSSCPSAADTGAVCNPNYCGGCKAVWTLRDEPYDCDKPCSGAIVDCFADPCEVNSCPKYPHAECKPNYCDGCFAEYYVDGERVTDCADPICPDGVVSVLCFAQPCSVSSCPAHPDATCTDNYCGGCSAIWKVNDTVVDCEHPEVPETPPEPCPTLAPAVICEDPCGKCPAYPNAECKVDFCGGCRARYYVDGHEVSCDEACTGLPCDDCLSKSYCSYCSGSTPLLNRINASWGICVSTTAAFASTRCPALLSPGSAAQCPANLVEAVDPVKFEIPLSPITDKFVLVITLVVNDTALNDRSAHLVRIFIDIVGTGSPTADDEADVCEALRKALANHDSRVKRLLDVKCDLKQDSTKKRDVAYVADLTFYEDSAAASALLAPVACLGIALAAMLF